MVSTRTQLGETPRKTTHPDYVETPGTTGRRRGPRKSIVPSDEKEQDSSDASTNGLKRKVSISRSSKSELVNGSVTKNGTANGVVKRSREKKDPRVDDSGEFEFGGDFGVTAMMIGFPL